MWVHQIALIDEIQGRIKSIPKEKQLTIIAGNHITYLILESKLTENSACVIHKVFNLIQLQNLKH